MDTNKKATIQAKLTTRMNALLDQAEQYLEKGDPERAQQMLEQCAILTDFSNIDVLKLLTRVNDLRKNHSASAIQWLQATQRILKQNNLLGACNCFINAFNAFKRSSDSRLIDYFVPHAETILDQLAAAITTDTVEPLQKKPARTLVVLTNERAQVQYLRLLRALFTMHPNSFQLLILFSEADEKYLDSTICSTARELSTLARECIRPTGETSRLERITFALTEAMHSTALITDLEVTQPESILLAQCALNCAVPVLGCAFSECSFLNRATHIFCSEEILGYSPVSATALLPTVKNQEPRLRSARNTTGHKHTVTIILIAETPFSAVWLTVLSEQIEKLSNLAFLFAYEKNALTQIPAELLNLPNVFSEEIQNIELAPFADTIFLFIADARIESTVFSDCFAAGTPIACLTDSQSHRDLRYPSFSSECCIVLSETDAASFAIAFSQYTRNDSDQQRISLLATTKSLRCSYRAVSDSVVVAVERIHPEEIEPTTESVESIDFQIPESTVPAPKITTCYISQATKRIDDLLVLLLPQITNNPITLVTGQESVTNVEPVLKIPTKETGLKFKGETERALIDYLTSNARTTELLYVGLQHVAQMAEFNARVLQVPYSILLLDSDLLPDSHSPAFDFYADFFEYAQSIYIPGSTTSTKLESFGITRDRFTILDIPAPQMQNELHSKEAVSIAAITETTQITMISEALRSSVSAPHRLCFCISDTGNNSEERCIDIARAPLEELSTFDIAIFFSPSESSETPIPSYDLLLKQLSAAGSVILSANPAVTRLFEHYAESPPIPEFASLSQLSNQLAGLLSDPEARSALAERQFSCISGNLQTKTTTAHGPMLEKSLPDQVRMLLAEKAYAAALEQLGSALTTDPDNPGLLVMQAEALLGLSETKTARSIVLRVLSTFPDHVRAKSLLETIDTKTADTISAHLDSTEAKSVVDRALAELRNGNSNRAKELLLSHANEPVPRDYYHTLALCYAKEGEYKKSLEAVQSELLQYPDNQSAQKLKNSLVAIDS